MRTLFFCMFSLISLVISCPNIYAQDQEENPYPSTRRLFFGGNTYLQFGTYTDIVLSPLAGYWLTPRLAPGIGVKYEYMAQNGQGTHVYGGSIFSSFLLIRNLNKVIDLIHSNIGIMAHAEYETLSLEKKFFNPLDTSPGLRYLQDNLYIGGGIRQPIGDHSSFYLLVLYNLNQDLSSYYSNPVFRIGFTF